MIFSLKILLHFLQFRNSLVLTTPYKAENSNNFIIKRSSLNNILCFNFSTNHIMLLNLIPVLKSCIQKTKINNKKTKKNQ